MRLALDRGSRGEAPQLLVAAKNGHDSIVEWLLEAKAAVDQKDNEGRGLGRGFKGKNLLRAWDRCEKVNEMWMVQFSWWILLSIFLESLPKEMHQHFLLYFEIRTLSSFSSICF